MRKQTFFAIVSLPSYAAIGLIRLYQIVLSPWLRFRCCRFYPTCSQYALESCRRWGVLKGAFMTVRRLCKCHPFHPGGVDLVPTQSKGSHGN